MKLGSLTRRLGLAAVAFLVVAACGSSPGDGSASCSESTAKTASSATACGGMDALVAAGKAEGALSVIPLPPDCATYGAIIGAVSAQYHLAHDSVHPRRRRHD